MHQADSPFRVTTEVNDANLLRQRLADEGYLFIKGLAPRDRVLQVRRDVLEHCRDAGWLARGSELMDGIWSGVGPYTEGEAEYMAVYRQVLHTPSFIDLPADPVLLSLMEKLLGGPPLLHRRRIGRITFPNNTTQTTAAHQDFQYIRGTPQTYTLWLPLGECPIELGGLAVLQGSHRAGFIEHRFDPEKKYAGHGLTEEQFPPGQWVASDFDVGDVLVFHSHTIHKALPNLTQDRLRLSTDNRYQLVGSEIEAGAMGTHYNL